MKKISTLFKKNPENLGLVINEIAPENQWVFDGEGNSDSNTIQIEIMTKREKDYAVQKDSYSTQKVTVIK